MPTQGPVAEQFAPVAEDNTAGVIRTEAHYSYAYQAGTTAGLAVKGSAGFLHSITIASPTATAVVTVYDNTAASGQVVFAHTCSAGNAFTCILDIVMLTGIELVIATAGANVTISYR
jgi:hypothetical protein